jgi:hypothetical protein
MRAIKYGPQDNRTENIGELYELERLFQAAIKGAIDNPPAVPGLRQNVREFVREVSKPYLSLMR